MSEIEKMYENAKVKKQIPKICSNNELYCKGCEAHIEDAMPYCKNAEYPPFTAAKQIAILCWLVNLKGNVAFNNKPENITPERLQEALAWAVNQYWTKLTPEQKQQIKEILE